MINTVIDWTIWAEYELIWNILLNYFQSISAVMVGMVQSAPTGKCHN